MTRFFRDSVQFCHFQRYFVSNKNPSSIFSNSPRTEIRYKEVIQIRVKMCSEPLIQAAINRTLMYNLIPRALCHIWTETKRPPGMRLINVSKSKRVLRDERPYLFLLMMHPSEHSLRQIQFSEGHFTPKNLVHLWRKSFFVFKKNPSKSFCSEKNLARFSNE